MSVIIRLQNLPWSANALDIRQFFRGLSIPEGGVHIVGGEMGDAFIAFSTDEDARQAMMHDREAINGVQIRLLLSSRAEMQKVIKVARQQSLLALEKASATVNQPKVSAPIAANVQKTLPATAPQPPIISASSFRNIIGSAATAGLTPSFLAYQQQAGLNLIPEINKSDLTAGTTASSSKNNDSDDSESRHSRDRRRSVSREHRRSRSRSRERSVFRRRRDHSRDRSRERERSSGRRSRHRSRSRERSRDDSRERSRDRSHDQSRTKNVDKSHSMDKDNKSNQNMTHWSAANAYQTNYKTGESGLNALNRVLNYGGNFQNSTTSDLNKPLEKSNKSMDSVSSSITGVPVNTLSSTFQNYKTTNQPQTAVNNYSLSSLLGLGNSSDTLKPFALQNPYTTALKDKPQEANSNITSSSAIPGIFVEKKPDESSLQANTMDVTNNLPQEPIAFANVNPYEQMYPNLFAQAAALSTGQKLTGSKPSMNTPTNSPRTEDVKPKVATDPNETNCVKISNMCSRTTYSDLRKFFGGLFIPHNGIKMLNDKHGVRAGIAYVQFSRQSSVAKALCRSNNIFKGKSVIIEPVSEQEFNEAEDSFRPPNQDKAYSHRSNDSDNENNDNGLHSSNNNYSALNPYKKPIQHEPFTVLYIEDIPALATEQDIMKMFSSYSLYDILLIASPENRREFVAHVRFSREEDAKSAYEDRAHHQIGYRRVRVRPGSIEEMENAKEKIRLANEQLMKEEQAAEEEEAKRKLEKLITDHITQEENKQQQQQSIVSMDLTQEDADDENEVIDTTNELAGNAAKNHRSPNDEETNYTLDSRYDIYALQNKNNKFNINVDPRLPPVPQVNNIPSLFDVDPLNNSNIVRNQNRPNPFNDPRLRNMSEREAASMRSMDNNKTNQGMGNNNFSNNLMNQSSINASTNAMNNTENNFVILKNCDYGTRINDVAQLLLTANLGLKHIEPLHNERHLPTGEFIVEFRRPNDAEIAVQRFHNIQFRNRSLRVFPITPQEIADRLDKPFLSYIPGGNGVRMNKSSVGDNNMQRNNFNAPNNNNNSNNNRFNNGSSQNNNFNNFRGNNPFSDNNGPPNRNNNNSNNGGGGGGIPDKFTRPGCVLSLENVPYKAQLSDILRFFQGFDLSPDDIIRRYNDDGTPTGDARVAFISPDEARAAFESKKRKQIFGRNVYISIIN